MAANGYLPSSQLGPIGGGFYLRSDAAAAFRAMSAAAVRRWGRPIRVRSAYRTYGQQVYFWNLFRSGRGNLAARPGTSNHGWGLAIDLASTWDRWAVDQIGSSYGFAKRWSDAPGEWWHVKYAPGHYKPAAGSSVLRRGSRGARVRALQKRLRALGYTGVKADGIYGQATVSAVKRFQKKHRLTADGRVGPATTRALKR
jgi:hypothetical protein